jgi:ABC-type glycerol-3-phosphate transport system permease component
MVAVPTAVHVALVWLPAAASVGLSFTRWNGIGGLASAQWIGTRNYRAISSIYPPFWPAVRHNLIWLVFLVVVPTVFGMFLATQLDKRIRLSRFYQSAIFLPVVLSFAVLGFIAQLVYSPEEGLINNVLGRTSPDRLIDWLGDPDRNLWAVLVLAGWRHAGYIMILYLAGLKSVDPSLREAATIDGASEWQAFRRVIFPELAPINIVVVVVTVIESLRAFDLVYVINKGRNGLELLSVLVTANILGEASRIGYGSAIAVILLVISLGCIVTFLTHAYRREGRGAAAGGERPGPETPPAAPLPPTPLPPTPIPPAPIPPLRAPRWRPPPRLARAALHAFLALTALVWLAPLLWTVYTSLRPYADTAQRGYFSVGGAYGLTNYDRAWREGELPGYFLNTVLITAPALLLTLTLASFVAFAVSRFPFRFSRTLLMLFTAGNLLPQQVIITPLYRLYLQVPLPYWMSESGLLYDSYWGVIAIHVAFQAGFCVFVLSNYMRTLPVELTEAALVDGAPVWRYFWRIVLPLCRPALAALATLEAIWIYNDFFWALVLMRSGDHRPVTSALANLRGVFFVDNNLIAAGALLAAVPTVVVYVVLQRQFLSGLTLGASKG